MSAEDFGCTNSRAPEAEVSGVRAHCGATATALAFLCFLASGATLVTPPAPQPPRRGDSLFGRAIGGFVPFGIERGYDRKTIRRRIFVRPGAAGGMAPGAGMGEAVTAREAVELLAKSAASRNPHYRSSGAAYGSSGAGYGAFGRGAEGGQRLPITWLDTPRAGGR